MYLNTDKITFIIEILFCTKNLFTLSLVVKMDGVACYYEIQHFHEKFSVYTCCLYKKEIGHEKAFSGQHLTDKTDDDVRGVAFSHCKFASFPRGISESFPNVNHITINEGLQEISKEDLAEFKNLKFLDLQGCRLVNLSSDLFENSSKLEVIYFSHNKILSIGENLLEPLENLKYIDFTGNPAINLVYDEDKSENFTLDDMKREIRKLNDKNCRR